MPITRNINDVDFMRIEKYNHPGNVTFYSLTRRCVQDGRYTPTMDDVHKRSLAADIQRHIRALRPPGRFLKNRISTGGSFELLGEGEIQKKIYKVLQKDWEDFSLQNAEATTTTTDTTTVSKESTTTTAAAAALAGTKTRKIAQLGVDETMKKRKHIEGEKRKRKNRREKGESIRKKFRPVIASLRDSHHLL